MFVYSVSHDLRSPLVNLQGFSKELEKGGRDRRPARRGGRTAGRAGPGRALLDRKMAKSIGFIQTAVLRPRRIIDALLRLSRAGRVEYRWEAVDVGRVVAQVVAARPGHDRRARGGRPGRRPAPRRGATAPRSSRCSATWSGTP